MKLAGFLDEGLRFFKLAVKALVPGERSVVPGADLAHLILNRDVY